MLASLQKFIIAVCLVLTWTEFCSSQEFEIVRENSQDIFTIPRSRCDKGNNTFDYCAEYNAEKDGNKNCRCFCGDHNATFSFHQQSWSCIGNEAARNVLGCSNRAFFEQEIVTDKLSFLEGQSDEDLSLTWAGKCVANDSYSWYIDCHGNKVSFVPAHNEFDIERDGNKYILKLDLSDNDPLIGRVVNLGITCTGSAITLHKCLLFKIEGRTNCPVIVPRTTNETTTTTITDKVIKSTSKDLWPYWNSASSQPPTEVIDGPSSAADKDEDSEGGVSSSSAVGIIFGVNASLILKLVIGFFIYRWKYSRKQPQTSDEGQTSQTSQTGDAGFQSGEQNDGYATLNYNDSTPYASNYVVPNDTQNNAPSSAAQLPVYHVLDDVNTDTAEDHYEYIPAEGYQKDAPLFAVEQPLYNMMEVLNTDTTEGHDKYVPTEECQNDTPLNAVEQPLYNVLEVPNTDTTEGHCEYVATEEFQNGAPLNGVEQPLYNVLEVLNTDTTEDMHDRDPAKRDENNAPFSVDQRVYNFIENFDTGPSSDNPGDLVYI